MANKWCAMSVIPHNSAGLGVKLGSLTTVAKVHERWGQVTVELDNGERRQFSAGLRGLLENERNRSLLPSPVAPLSQKGEDDALNGRREEVSKPGYCLNWMKLEERRRYGANQFYERGFGNKVCLPQNKQQTTALGATTRPVPES